MFNIQFKLLNEFNQITTIFLNYTLCTFKQVKHQMTPVVKTRKVLLITDCFQKCTWQQDFYLYLSDVACNAIFDWSGSNRLLESDNVMNASCHTV